MSRYDDYIFVLWGDEFEEVPAVVFVKELRRAGLRVKVVGLSARRSFGASGLALVPDLTLDQALMLASQAICLVIPQMAPNLQTLKNEPRLSRLIERIAENPASFVIGPLNGVDRDELDLFPPVVAAQLMVYPQDEDLTGFACELAHLFLGG